MANKRVTPSSETKPSGAGPGALLRRWLRIGPGMILAIAAAIYIWAQQPRVNQAPGIERTRVEAPEAPPAAPDPDWLLANTQDLSLTPSQQNRLSRLGERWKKETQPLRAELEQATADFEQRRSQDGGQPPTLEKLQAEAGPVSELSSRLGAARRVWWEEAKMVLTPEQRQKAENRWRERLTGGRRQAL